MDKQGGEGASLLGLYNQRLKEAEGIPTPEPAPLQLQRDTIRGLSEYVSAQSRAAGDNRRRIFVVRELLDDMGSHLPWAGSVDTWEEAIGQANRELRHMTALQPIRFTRVLLGWEGGPMDSAFLPGLVMEADEILASDFYAEMRWRYGGYEKWPALCTVYAGGDNPFETRDADAFDVAIMNEAGDDFLKEPGIKWAGGSHEIEIHCGPEMAMQ